MYDFILYDLKRKGMNITYENKTTGTISFINNGKKTQISVYRGYNSHANSKYWQNGYLFYSKLYLCFNALY